MQIRPFDEADAEQLVHLWRACGLTRSWNDPSRDIARKLQVQRELFLVGVDDAGAVIASVMGGYEGHRGWANYLAVSPHVRGQGYARALMTELEALLQVRGCPKLNLQVRGDNPEAIAVYRALGYSVDDTVSLGKRLIAD